MPRLRHLFRLDPSTTDHYGVKCLHCGGREHELEHLSWVESIKYDWRFRGQWDPKRERWAWIAPASVRTEARRAE